jgi:TolB-like protein/Tfp pilus assembly protein PilF
MANTLAPNRGVRCGVRGKSTSYETHNPDAGAFPLGPFQLNNLTRTMASCDRLQNLASGFQTRRNDLRSRYYVGDGAKMNSFFRELKQRKVYRVALGYAVVAWLVIQISATVMPAYHAPDWFLPIFITVIALGFPVALVLAWAFELKGGAIEKAPEPTGHLSAANKRRVWLLAAVGLIISGLAVGGYWLWHPWRNIATASQPNTAPVPTAPEKSIAVLPFENLSEEKANAYFAEGVQNEILTRLATVRDLKVISRTSTAKYQSKPENLKTVAQELGVSTILEGAVQKAGEKVRVNVQLIDARADTHLWGKSYDRDFKDVLGVESEVSQEIAEALQAKLSPSESHVLASTGTHDAEAYDLFLRGEYEFHEAGTSLAADAYDRADGFYRQALARDPNFAEAAAELARSRLRRQYFISPLAPAELEEVKSIIDRALALAPNSPEAHLALGSFFGNARQYENALTEFNRTLELQPNNALAQLGRGGVYGRRGEWERSLADLQRAQELDPRDATIPTSIGFTYMALRLWKDAECAELRALAIDPHYALAALNLAGIRLNSTGDVGSARRALDDFPQAIKSLTLISPRATAAFGDVASMVGHSSNWVYLDVIERRFTDAFQEFEKKVVNDDRGHLQQLAGRVALRLLAGQTEAAKSAGEEARPLIEARLRERPDDTFAMTALSWVYLALGRNTDALRISRQAADSISIEKDALTGPFFQNGLAQIEARAGAPEEAIKRLRRLLSIPAGYPASIALLKIDPVWDTIRNRPDFQQLLLGPEQIGPNK